MVYGNSEDMAVPPGSRMRQPRPSPSAVALSLRARSRSGVLDAQDLLVEGQRLRTRGDALLAPQHGATGVVLPEHLGPLARSRVAVHEGPVPRLALRLERHETTVAADRLGHPTEIREAGGQALQHLDVPLLQLA